MSMLTPSQIRQLCEQYQLNPSKKYGQNYLISDLPVKKMVDAAGIQPGSTVYEIGPGFGVLTFELLQAGARVRAFEIEQKLKPYWEDQMKNYSNLEIVWGNVLHKWDEYSDTEKEYVVAANLPYQITSEALQTMLESQNPPSRIVCMVQKEVAERIVARPGDMSILAVSVQYFGTPRIIARVGKGSFFPSPKVDSAVISISDISPMPGRREFFKLVKAGFRHKRKLLSNNIASVYHVSKEQVETYLEQVGLHKTVRAEELSVAQWKELTKLLTS